MKDKIREICYDLEIGCIDWTEASEQLLVLFDVSQQRELLLGFQKSEWFDLYEQGVLEYKDAIEKYLA